MNSGSSSFLGIGKRIEIGLGIGKGFGIRVGLEKD